MIILTSEFAEHPLMCRPDTSDRAVFDQIFTFREYSCLDDVGEAGLIVDCGAYVGYSSAYFLTRFPRGEVIAVEPDPESFELLCENLSPYGDRVTLLRAAVWSHPTPLTLAETKYRDGREWSRQVRECRSGEIAAFPAVEIGDLLDGSKYDRISVLKIDIEGAEAQVFSSPSVSWIDRVDHLIIEIHDDSDFGNNTARFEQAVAGRGFAISRSGELTVCKRR
jgi:FkbM family methyltransferase